MPQSRTQSLIGRLVARSGSGPGKDKGAGELENDQFRKVFESLALGGVWSTSPDGTLLTISSAIEEMISPDQNLLGRHICDIFCQDENSEDSSRSLRIALSRRTRFERMALQTRFEEAVKWWSVSGEAQFDASGQFLGFYGFCTDITNDRLAVEQTEQLAMHDALTGLLNRRRMTDLLDRTLAAYQYQQRSCATMLIDLDRFKQINDTLGHAIGDGLLKQVGERLVTIVGDREKVCRLGGDEFQVILPDCDDRGALGDLAGRIISMLSQPYTVEGSRCIIGASVGIGISPFDGAERGELMRNADLALYAAKHAGRGRFCFFTRDLLEAVEERKVLEEDLHDAIERGELELHFQPVVSATTNRVVGAEALVRWTHPERGKISPQLFIPIAEESSLISRIGEWILRQGCEQAARWPGSLRLAVNVSPVQFIDPGFPNMVAQALAVSGLSPDRLELEITEGVFLAEGNSVDETFAMLKNLGVRMALDDFGTGYSSLAYLKSAPFDKIKIDQSFVRGATVNGSRNRAIITAIVGLAQALDMETTAEGVETFDQLEMVRQQGVSLVQGYLYSPPLPNSQFVEQANQAEWGIEPSGHARQRHERIKMYRKIGAIHEDHYYTVMLRNLSASGALIEGLLDVPVGTQFVLDFGEGQLAVATVRRSRNATQGVEFEKQLVSDGNGGLCTRSRISPYLLAAAGLPDFATSTGPLATVGEKLHKVTIPAFLKAEDRRAIVSR
ncbi:MAG: EAL domain-containing protein [Novosphingobium sp.]|uniref:EAL domain-containing protein n=1 Tax=Novosphingobium sp. TaxID=1874826 RepID=UPI00262994E9|nr:EAL domain-containing protein [Novosphingobium sp.]MCP5387842.1 EAL domain-containing protein [Novosphingobium sp.]